MHYIARLINCLNNARFAFNWEAVRSYVRKISQKSTTKVFVYESMGYLKHLSCETSFVEYPPNNNTDLQAGICFGEAHRTMQGASKKRNNAKQTMSSAVCALSIYSRLCIKCRLFCLCAHGQCRIYYIYHVEFHFWFKCLVSFPV